MKRKKIMPVILAALSLIAVANLIFTALAAQAINDVHHAYKKQHALIAATYEWRLSFASMFRLSRAYAVSGREVQVLMYFTERDSGRIERATQVFHDFNAPQNELDILQSMDEMRTLVALFTEEAFRLRGLGYAQEAIDLLHGTAHRDASVPLPQSILELQRLVWERTQTEIDTARATAIALETLIMLSAGILVAAGVVGIVFKFSATLKILAVVVVLLAASRLYFSATSSRAAAEISETYALHTALMVSIYDTEMATETLNRLSRAFVILGGEIQYNSYWEEVAEDHFGYALDTFITQQAKSREINAFVSILTNVIAMGQIETQAIPLRMAGYESQARELLFGREVLSRGIAIGEQSLELREMIEYRITGERYAARAALRTGGALSVVSAGLLILVGIVAVLVAASKKSDRNEHFLWGSYVFVRLTNTSIKARMVASFTTIIALFFIYVIVTTYTNAEMSRLNYANRNYMAERVMQILSYQYEFAEMRRIMQTSFMNQSWIDTANEGIWRNYEHQLSAVYAQLLDLVDDFTLLVHADPHFPVVEHDSRLRLMHGIADYTSRIYTIFSHNFFWDSEITLDYGDLMYYSQATEDMISLLRRIVTTNHDILAEDIADFHRFINDFAATTIMLMLVLTLVMSYLMVQSFSGKVRAAEVYVQQIRMGNFSAASGSKDEISHIIASMVDVFTQLANEIDNVALEAQKGNLNARMDTSRFEGEYREAANAVNRLIKTIEESQNRAKDAAEDSLAKSRFLARMSHEIRTPITAVLGIAEIHLQLAGQSLATEEAFAGIFNSANILLGIVNDILDLSKIEAGKMSVMEERYELASMITDVVQMHLVYLGSKDIEFKVEADENLPAYVVGDELRIKQILNNLLSNAFKYTDSGTVEFAVQEEPHEDAGLVNVRFSIRDTGLGMTAEQVESLQAEYVRFHESENRTGAGLGMTIVYNLVNIMQGHMTVESVVGEGTIVSIVLPQKISSEEKLGADTVNNLRQSEILGRSIATKLKFVPDAMPYGKVLVVDDIDTNLYVAKGLLMFYELEIETCTCAADAIEKIKGGAVYDIIFMDYMMPEMDGIQATKILRNMGYNEPIIALTANALIGQAEEFIRNGFDSFVSKPIQTAHLNAVLNKYIRDKQPPEIIAEAQSRRNKGDNNFLGMDSYLKREAEKLRRDFVKSQGGTAAAIKTATDAADMITAQRLAHNLKSLAGLIHEEKLAQSAAVLERQFKNGEYNTQDLADMLEELARVLAYIGEPEEEPPITDELSPGEQTDLFNSLQPLLESGDTECLEFVSKLKQVPETAVLVSLMENYEFESAAAALRALRTYLSA